MYLKSETSARSRSLEVRPQDDRKYQKSTKYSLVPGPTRHEMSLTGGPPFRRPRDQKKHRLWGGE